MIWRGAYFDFKLFSRVFLFLMINDITTADYYCNTIIRYWYVSNLLNYEKIAVIVIFIMKLCGNVYLTKLKCAN